jgi:lipopolysaccharide biosynthesis regulator YciM
MEFELWWLTVIPLFFGLGWLAARIDARHLIRQSSKLPDAYFRGLNFLLNEQPDKAIDAFVDVVRLDPETVELHFALGNLFRRRGETDRAIRVHQSLAGRSDLSPAQREHALFELGQDFLRAGLLDRAEDAFNRLEATDHAAAALRHRLELAQMVRDWPRAIDIAQGLRDDAAAPGIDRGGLLAHFHCELAQKALAGQGSPDDRRAQALRELQHALDAAPAHPRPWLLRGEIAFDGDDFAGAIDAWEQVARISPAHLALTGERWLEAHERVGRLDAGLDSLERIQESHPSVDALRAVAQARARRDGAPAALEWLRGVLARSPSLLGLEQLLELRATIEADDPCAADTALTASLIRHQSARLSRFVCGHCGFKARRFYWQCPGCHRWDSYPPRRTEALEAEGG